MTEVDLAAWLKKHRYIDAAVSPWGRGWIHVMVNPDNFSEQVRMITNGRGDAELNWHGQDRTWIPEMDSAIHSGALTPLEARHTYAAQIEALYRQQQEAA